MSGAAGTVARRATRQLLQRVYERSGKRFRTVDAAICAGAATDTEWCELLTELRGETEGARLTATVTDAEQALRGLGEAGIRDLGRALDISDELARQLIHGLENSGKAIIRRGNKGAVLVRLKEGA